MGLEYTRKGKIWVSIIAIYTLIGGGLLIGGCIGFAISTDDIFLIDLDAMYYWYYIGVGGAVMLMILCIFLMFPVEHDSWYQWVNKGGTKN